MSFKHYLDTNNYDAIERLIETQLNKFDFYKFSNFTGIKLFDEEIVKYFISLENDGFSIKKVITINNTRILENENFVKEIKAILKQITEFCLDNKTFEFYLYEVNEFVVLKILTLCTDKVFKFNDSYDESVVEKRKLKIKNDNIEIKVLFKIN